MPAYTHARSIGGSDAGALIGVNRYKTPQQVWDRIQGVSRDNVDNLAMERGRVLEPYVINERYPRETRRTVEECELINHGELPFLHARPDGAITGGLRVAMDGNGILEVKVPGSWNYSLWTLEGLDESYYAQLQHYLFVTGFKWGSFGILNADTFEFRWFDVERDESYIARMVDTCVRFWNDYVVTGIRPPSSIVEPGNVFPAARAGAEAVEHNEPEWVRAMEALKTAQQAKILGETQYELASDAIKALMGEAEEVVVVPGIGKISWKESARTSFDKDALIAEHPEIDVERFTRVTYSRSFRPTFRG